MFPTLLQSRVFDQSNTNHLYNVAVGEIMEFFIPSCDFHVIYSRCKHTCPMRILYSISVYLSVIHEVSKTPGSYVLYIVIS